MRIIHLSCVAPPETGGIGSVAFKEVSLLRARGVDARLLAPRTPPSPLVRGGSDKNAERSFVDRLPTLFRIGNASVMRGVRNAIKDADIIHLHYPFYGTAEPLLFGFFSDATSYADDAIGIPTHRRDTLHATRIVVTYHMDASAGGIKGVAFAAHRWLFQNALLSRADRVLVSSLDYALHASLGSFFAKHADRVVELPFGVDTDVYSPGASEKTRYDIPADAPVVGFVGGLDRAHAFKGLSSLLSAFPRLDASAFLLVVGDGDLRPLFEKRAKELGIEKRVRFTGRVSADELPRAYRSMDVFAFPSTNAAEAFGLAALEAQSSGVPVVASDLPGVRTVVSHGETGWLVPPNQPDALAAALMTILSDQPRRTLMSQHAREKALTFSWEKHMEGLMKVYDEVNSETKNLKLEARS